LGNTKEDGLAMMWGLYGGLIEMNGFLMMIKNYH